MYMKLVVMLCDMTAGLGGTSSRAEQHGGAPAPRGNRVESSRRLETVGRGRRATVTRLGRETSCGCVAAKRPGRASVGPAFVSDL